MTGYIHSLQSLGTVDGPGVRAVVFTAGCPLRCAYCHNPDTWHKNDGILTDSSELADKILRLYPYIKNGGVTFSGGEPCLQAGFLCELADKLKEKGLHIALDTSGAVQNDETDALIDRCDLVLLDVKMTNEDDYLRYTGGSLSKTLSFLEKLRDKGVPVWIRNVVVPTINDTEDSVRALKALVAPYDNVERIELLPFRKLCLEKYSELGLDFPLAHLPQLSESKLQELKAFL